MEFKAIKLECLKTEPVETMDFKKEIDDDDTFDHGPLPGDNLNAPAARTFSHEQNQTRRLETAMTQMDEFRRVIQELTKENNTGQLKVNFTPTVSDLVGI